VGRRRRTTAAMLCYTSGTRVSEGRAFLHRSTVLHAMNDAWSMRSGFGARRRDARGPHVPCDCWACRYVRHDGAKQVMVGQDMAAKVSSNRD